MNASISSNLTSANQTLSNLNLNSEISFFLGAIFTLITSFILNYYIHWLNRKRDAEERKESFKLKLYELKIQAAQTAYQYIYKVYRASSRANSMQGAIALDDPIWKELRNLTKEARDWLDGQVLILEEKVYKKVFYYFNSVGDEKQYEIMEDAKKALKATLRKDFVETE